MNTLGARKIQDENVTALRMEWLFPDENSHLCMKAKLEIDVFYRNYLE
jgi:hypothetical protein